MIATALVLAVLIASASASSTTATTTTTTTAAMEAFLLKKKTAMLVPEQVHLTLHPDPSKMVVTWTSFEVEPYSSVVQFGPSATELTHQNQGRFMSYPNEHCGEEYTRSIHSADFDVPEGETVFYRLSSDSGATWSTTFQTVGPSRRYPQTFALWGDMGVNVADDRRSDWSVAEDAANGVHQLAIHYGDTAYNMDDECGVIGDTFLNTIMSYATSIPLIFTNGNHESGTLKRYEEYIYRLADGQHELGAASGSNSNRYFMWSFGQVTFIAIDPDAYIYPPVFPLAEPQYEWLDAAMATINRTVTPWVVFLTHRALYCTFNDSGECNREALALRYGFLHQYFGLEPLLEKYGVDLVFAGHTHHAQRSWPVLDGEPTQLDYINPRAPVHVLAGIAGVGGPDRFEVDEQPWEAFRDYTYQASYARLTVHNNTHATVQLLRGVDGTQFDFFELRQDNHGPF